MTLILPPTPTPLIAYKRSASPLTTGTLWTYTGGIYVLAIHGIVRTVIQAQATNVKLSLKNDALTAFDLCTNLDATGDAVGTVYSLPAAVASALVATTDGALITLLAQPHLAICSTSGVITVTYGAASTGIIDWYMRWEPATPNASVT
jgi:hypothetical protein